MGLFDRGKRSDRVQDDVEVADTSGIDFSKYDLSTLGDDVASIVSIPNAVAQAAKWAFGLPIVVGIISWIVFSGRMSGWALVPFVLIAMFLSVFGSVFIGGYFVARQRLDLVSQATNRVVTVVNEMHTDVVQIKEGASTTSVKALSKGLLENAIFPVAFGFVEGMAPDAGGGIISKLGSRFTDAPMKLVQKSVIGAVDRLPDKQIGSLASDLTNSMPEMSNMLSELNDNYQRIAGDIESVVSGVSKATLTSAISAAAVATVPVLLWLVFGWVVS